MRFWRRIYLASLTATTSRALVKAALSAGAVGAFFSWQSGQLTTKAGSEIVRLRVLVRFCE